MENVFIDHCPLRELLQSNMFAFAILISRLERDIDKILARLENIENICQSGVRQYFRRSQIDPSPPPPDDMDDLVTEEQTPVIVSEIMNPTTLKPIFMNLDGWARMGDPEGTISPEDKLGNNPILFVSSASDSLEVKGAAESTKQNAFYILHTAVGLSFDFPKYFKEEISAPLKGFPFPLVYDGEYPIVESATAEMLVPYCKPTMLNPRLLDNYFRKIHPWFPFLDSRYLKKELIDIQPHMTSKYWMYLLLMALGSMVRNDEVSKGLSWGEEYARPAFSIFSIVALEVSITGVHCLILFAYCLI